MRTIQEVKEQTSIANLSPDFRPVVFSSFGRRVAFSFRSGGKFHPWDIVISVSRDVAREAKWAGESHVAIGVNRNPTIKQIELRKCPETTHSARKIGKTGQNILNIKMPYVKDFYGVIPEVSALTEAKITVVDDTHIVLDFSGIKPTGLPQKKERKCKLRTNTSSSTTVPTPTAGCPTH